LTLLKTNKKITLNSANRIYYSIDNFLHKTYVQSTRELFLAEPIGMNFGRAEQSRTAINQWVEEETNKKIQELIPEGSFNALTKLVLVNAIYFKGNWDVKFDKSKTQKRDFHVSPTQTVQTDMMFSTNKYGMLSDVKDLQGATALDMPYKGKRLSMIFLLPNHNHNSLADLEEAMSKVADLNSILRFGRKTKVKVTLPRFKLESQFDLVQPLMQLGMTDMFDENKADFSGMTGGTNKGLFVSQVAQKAFIEVNEEGAEATAATFAVVQSRSGWVYPPTPTFTCNRPFMFLIRDNLTGMILFSGHVTDPSK
jgi:serine protease inhibitor